MSNGQIIEPEGERLDADTWDYLGDYGDNDSDREMLQENYNTILRRTSRTTGNEWDRQNKKSTSSSCSYYISLHQNISHLEFRSWKPCR
ncbi:hypothetical protein DL98DRAFT_314155 [Cadophora sp. DSE1049]|nr:hypothetical protein DL98DRAFT_314155 [Cadophora sp. DSE1049]